MREGGVGRVLVASLHQAIGDILPARLGFYENWLSAKGMREGTIGVAPTYAVLSFLRQEGAAYQLITTRAGEYAAELCGFYAAAFTRLLVLFNVPARTDVIACRGTGEATCLLRVALLNEGAKSVVEPGVRSTPAAHGV